MRFALVALFLAAAVSGNAAEPSGSGFLTIPLDKASESRGAPVAADGVAESHPEIGSETLKRLGRHFERVRKQTDVPGLAVAVVQGNKPVLVQAYGVRRAGGEPVTPSTRFALGPVSQGLSSLLVASLMDRERLDWDKPVRRINPDVRLNDKVASKKLTIRDLMTMTAGVPSYADNIVKPENAVDADVFELLRQMPVTAQPGEAYANSELSFTAGVNVSVIATAGSSRSPRVYFEKLLRERVLEPVGMTTSVVSPGGEGMTDAQGYSRTAEGWKPVTPPNLPEGDYLAPARGIRASVADVALWLATELGEGVTPGGKRIAKVEDVRTRWRPTRVRDASQYGMGWVRHYEGPTEVIFRSGSHYGQSALIGFFPRYRTGFVALANAEGEPAAEAFQDVMKTMVEVLRDAERKAQKAPDAPKLHMEPLQP